MKELVLFVAASFLAVSQAAAGSYQCPPPHQDMTCQDGQWRVAPAQSALTVKSKSKAADQMTIRPSTLVKQIQAPDFIASARELLAGDRVKDTAGCLYIVGVERGRLVLKQMTDENGKRICQQQLPKTVEPSTGNK